jgi:hypothetical protein
MVYNQNGMHKADGSELGPPEAPLLLARAIQALEHSGGPEAVATDALIPRRLVEDLLVGS